MSAAASIYFYDHTPSGQSRVCRVTQMCTDGVHCRESAGTGPVVLKVVRVAGAAFASPWTDCYCAPLFSHTHYWYKVSMFKLSGVYQNVITAVLLYCFVDPSPPPPRLMPVQVKESSVHGTISSVVCQNIISSVLLLYCGPVPSPPDLCLYKCKELSAIAYRWRSLPRVRRHRASKSQGNVSGSDCNSVRLRLKLRCVSAVA